MADISLAPIVGTFPRVLILGSFPGGMSLRLQQYYGHPQNAFWRILADLGLVDAAADYSTRIAQVQAGPLALWDTIGACERPGSLDTSIVPGTIVPNDVAGLLAAYPTIHRVLLNGGMAWSQWQRYHRKLAAEALRMPSTSPANASWPYPRKLAAWQEALGDVL